MSDPGSSSLFSGQPDITLVSPDAANTLQATCNLSTSPPSAAQECAQGANKNGETFNPDKALDYLHDNAFPDKYHGKCAKHVWRAIAVGYGKNPQDPHFEDDRMHGDPNDKNITKKLNSLNFQPVPDDEDYSPQRGDVVVIGPTPGHKTGHMAMWDGHQWVSDYEQDEPNDDEDAYDVIYPGDGLKIKPGEGYDVKPKCTIYRSPATHCTCPPAT